MNRLFTIAILVLITQVSCAQKRLLHVVKTKNGTTVNLYSDNTWDYSNAAPSYAKLSTSSYNIANTGGATEAGRSGIKKKGSVRRSATGRVYYTGPRGGCYYVTAGGNKVYVDRSYCN